MSTILGINISHDNSICQITDGKIDFYYDEGRVARVKYIEGYLNDDIVNNKHIKYQSVEKYVKNVDKVIYTSYGASFDKFYIEDIQSQLGNPEYKFFPSNHHLYHALCGLHFSKFDEAIAIVMDGGGAAPFEKYKTHREVETIFYVNNETTKKFYSHLTNIKFVLFDGDQVGTSWHIEEDGCLYKLSSEMSSGQKFGCLSYNIGFGGKGPGKTMGLAPYGKLIGDRPEDLARQLQEETKNHTIELIKKAISYSDCKNIILSGGYALNCTNNYEYLSAFPDYNFFVDPVSHDGGTAIGAALYYERLLK